MRSRTIALLNTWIAGKFMSTNLTPKKDIKIQKEDTTELDAKKYRTIKETLTKITNRITLADTELRSIEQEIGKDASTLNCPKGCALQQYTATLIKILRNDAQELNRLLTQK
jgi:hypothetical protein